MSYYFLCCAPTPVMSYFLSCAPKGRAKQRKVKFNETVLKASIHVKRLAVVILRKRDNGVCNQGTGILIHGSWILTSHMTLQSIESAQDGELVVSHSRSSNSSTPPQPGRTILTRKLLPTRLTYFVTNSELGVTVVGCDPVSSEVSPLELGSAKLQGDVLNLGHSVYVLGHVQHDDERKGLVMFGEGRISSESERAIEFYSLDGNVWAPGSAGFDELGNFAFVVGDPKAPSAADFSTSSPQERCPVVKDSGSQQPGILVQFIREWMRSIGKGINNSSAVQATLLASTAKEFNPERIPEEPEFKTVQELWSVCKGANGEHIELHIQRRPREEKAAADSRVIPLELTMQDRKAFEARPLDPSAYFRPACHPSVLGGIAELASKELTMRRSDDESVLVRWEPKDGLRADFLHPTKGNDCHSLQNDFVTGFINIRYFNNSILAPDTTPVLDSPKQDPNRGSWYRWGKRAPSSRPVSPSQRDDIAPLAPEEVLRESRSEDDAVVLSMEFNSEFISREPPQESNARLVRPVTLTTNPARGNNPWPELILHPQAVAQEMPDPSRPGSPRNSPSSVPDQLSHFSQSCKPTAPRQLVKPIPPELACGLIHGTTSPRPGSPCHSPRSFPDQLSHFSLSCRPTSPRQLVKPVPPELAFGLIHRTTSSRPSHKVEAVPWRPSGGHGDPGTSRQNLKLVTEERNVMPVGSPRQGAPRLVTELRKRGCDEKKPDAEGVRKKREKEHPGKPRWSEHSKVHKEDYNRKLARLPPRVVKPGEFPAGIFSSQLKVPSAAPENKGRNLKVEMIADQELDADVLPDIFINSRPRSPYSLHSPESVQKSKEIDNAKDSKPAVKASTWVSSNRMKMIKAGLERPLECFVSSGSDDEEQPALERSRVKAKKIKTELESSTSTTFPMENYKQVGWARDPEVNTDAMERIRPVLEGRVVASPQPKDGEQSLLRHPRVRSTQLKAEMSFKRRGKKDPQSPASPRVPEEGKQEIENHLSSKQMEEEVSHKLAKRELEPSSSSKTPTESNTKIEKQTTSKQVGKLFESSASPKCSAETRIVETETPMGSKQAEKDIFASSESHSPKSLAFPRNKKTEKQMSPKTLNMDDEMLKEIERLQAAKRSPRDTLRPREAPATSSNENPEMEVAWDVGNEPKVQAEMRCSGPVQAEGRFDVSPGEVWRATTSTMNSKQSREQVTEITCFQNWKIFVKQRRDAAMKSIKSVFTSQRAVRTGPVCARSCSSGPPRTTSINKQGVGGLPKGSQSEASVTVELPSSGAFWPFREGSLRVIDDDLCHPQSPVNLNPPCHDLQGQLSPIKQTPGEENMITALTCTHPVQLPLLCKKGSVDGSFSTSSPSQLIASELPTNEAGWTVWNGAFTCDDSAKLEPQLRNLWPTSPFSDLKPQRDAPVTQEPEASLSSKGMASLSPGFTGPSTASAANGHAGGEMINAALSNDDRSQQTYLLTSSAAPSKIQTPEAASPGKPLLSIARVDDGSTTRMDSLAALKTEASMEDDSECKQRSSVDTKQEVVASINSEKVMPIFQNTVTIEETLVGAKKLTNSSVSNMERPRKAPLDMGRRSVSVIGSPKEERTRALQSRNPISAHRKSLPRARTAEVGTNVICSLAEEGLPLSEKGKIVRCEVRYPTPLQGRPILSEKGIPRWRP